MKIRIKGNSVRYRLTRTEIARFGTKGFLEEKTEFPGGQEFYYCLERKEGIQNLEASFAENKIIIKVPQPVCEEWTNTEVIGFNHKLDLGEGKELFLLIEKDFVCLDHTTEDQSDNYPNPNKNC